MSKETKWLIAGDDWGPVQKGVAYRLLKDGYDFVTMSVGGKGIACYRWLFYDDKGHPFKAFQPRIEEEDDDYED